MSFQDLESGGGGGGGGGRRDSSQEVAAGIFQITTAVSTFRRLVNTVGTPKDTPDLRQRLHKTRQHIGQLVKDTSAKLKQESEKDQHTEVSVSMKCILHSLSIYFFVRRSYLVWYIDLPFMLS